MPTFKQLNIKTMKYWILPVATATALTPPLSFAATYDPVIESISSQDVIDILNTLVTWVFTVFLILSVIMIIFAAFQYLFAGGDENKIKSAHRALIFGIVGIMIALVSVALRTLLESLITP